MPVGARQGALLATKQHQVYVTTLGASCKRPCKHEPHTCAGRSLSCCTCHQSVLRSDASDAAMHAASGSGKKDFGTGPRVQASKGSAVSPSSSSTKAESMCVKISSSPVRPQ